MNKLRILLAIAATFCVSSAFAQGNCSFIQNFLTSDTKNVGTNCDVHFNETVSETQTYNVQCIDQTKNNSLYFSVTSQMSSTGTSSLSCGGPNPIDCSPTFQPQNVNAGFTTASDNINKFFLRVWARQQSGAECVQLSMSQDLKQCAAVQCTAAGGSGGGTSGCTGGGTKTTLAGGNTGGDGGTCSVSPVIVDTQGEGFSLTSAAAGVVFDIRADGHPVQIAWTARGSHNAFLALDRNHNGLIDDGSELFGNFTFQSHSPNPNGFLALAEFDKPNNGGNGDGMIDERDSVYSQLLLWIDENHDGISQPIELHKLSEFGIHSISLQYVESRREDDFGNQFRYKAQINPGVERDLRDRSASGQPGRWAYDVFLVLQP